MLPPSPTHFLSRASRRLPELQQQLNLNPEHSSPDLTYEPSEIDPLLSYPALAPSPYLPDQLPPLQTQPDGASQDHWFSPQDAQLPLPSPHRSVFPSSRPPRKLGTFDGVFLPTVLSIFNVIYFMRFGYSIGRVGLLGTIGLLAVACLIDLLTVFSLSAIATNGQVRGGGAYYLISRTLGPEFGGSIGILFCLGQAMTAAMNIIGFVEALQDIAQLGLHAPTPAYDRRLGLFQSSSGLAGYLMKTVALLGATVACIVLGRQKIFSGLTRSVSLILAITLFSMACSFLTRRPFSDPRHGMVYTSFSLGTLKRNLYPSYLAVGPDPVGEVRARFSDYQRVFGILFPSLSGILAGSSLSGELRKPSKSLPVGMLSALVAIILVYLLTLLGLSVTCGRESLAFANPDGLLNLVVFQISAYPAIMACGMLLSTLFSSILAISVCAKILQAVSRDGLIPILKPFFSQGSQPGDDPVYSILFCYLVCQLGLMVYGVDQIAIHVSTISLLVFACINLACFTLRIAGSPNFRPSFRLFSEWTALLGLVLAFSSMYLVDPVSASTAMIVMILLFMVIHYTSPAKQWGEVTQSIIYHQVRKYLLRLDERKDNVKYWRPQILLFTNDPRHDWNQIVFCNSLKKGGLYVLAHIIKSEFSSESIQELHQQQLNWLGLVDISNIKAFVDITLAPDERMGARQLLLTAGLGGMRPNICILGFPTNLKWRGKGKLVDDPPVSPTAPTPLRMKRRSDSSLTVRGMVIESAQEVKIDCLGSLPTDSQRSETPIKPTDFVGIIEDSLSLNKSVGLTYGFQDLRLPDSISRPHTDCTHDHPSLAVDGSPIAAKHPQGRRWIDLWPILREGESGWETYTMVLQLGTVLSMVPSWRHQHALRVTIFCEQDDEIAEERRRMEKLMSDLRIRATLRVCVLANGEISSYECLVKGKEVDLLAWSKLECTLAGDPWWETLKFMRAQDRRPSQSASQGGSTGPNVPADAGRAPGRSLNKELLTKNAQTNNIRIKALHPFSRRGSRDSPQKAGQGQPPSGDDDEDLMLEEDDGDDDTVARQAYSRTKKPPAFQGLPDEPGSVSARTSAHKIDIGGHERTFGDETLDLQSLSASSLTDESRRAGMVHKRGGVGGFKKGMSRAKMQKGLATALHRKNLTRQPGGEGGLRGGQAGEQESDRSWLDSSSSDSSPSSSPSSPPQGAHNQSPLPVIELDFNSLPMRAQLICLNELVRRNSDREETAIIFTSLPPPEEGSSNSYGGSSRYLDQLESFLDGLPPVLAIYAKQFTVTASL